MPKLIVPPENSPITTEYKIEKMKEYGWRFSKDPNDDSVTVYLDMGNGTEYYKTLIEPEFLDKKIDTLFYGSCGTAEDISAETGLSLGTLKRSPNDFFFTRKTYDFQHKSGGRHYTYKPATHSEGYRLAIPKYSNKHLHLYRKVFVADKERTMTFLPATERKLNANTKSLCNLLSGILKSSVTVRPNIRSAKKIARIASVSVLIDDPPVFTAEWSPYVVMDIKNHLLAKITCFSKNIDNDKLERASIFM